MCDRSEIPSPAPSSFFSPIPRTVWDLCRRRALKPRDVEVLGVLLDHKNRDSTTVKPRQSTLAERLGCSVDTVQRAIRRLEKAGLVAVTRLRDKLGRLARCIYDLAGTLALMPAQAAKLRLGQWGEGGARATAHAQTPHDGERAQGDAPAGGRTMPQNCGVPGVDGQEIVQADNAPVAARAQPKPSPTVVAQMISLGVAAAAAERGYRERGEAYCRRVLEAAERVRRFRTGKAAWIAGALKAGDYAFGETAAAGECRPSSHRPYAHAWAGAGAPPPDPLTGLPAERLRALEAAARAQLLAQEGGIAAALLRRGKGWTLVRAQMRELARP